MCTHRHPVPLFVCAYMFIGELHERATVRREARGLLRVRSHSARVPAQKSELGGLPAAAPPAEGAGGTRSRSRDHRLHSSARSARAKVRALVRQTLQPDIRRFCMLLVESDSLGFLF